MCRYRGELHVLFNSVYEFHCELFFGQALETNAKCSAVIDFQPDYAAVFDAAKLENAAVERVTERGTN